MLKQGMVALRNELTPMHRRGAHEAHRLSCLDAHVLHANMYASGALEQPIMCVGIYIRTRGSSPTTPSGVWRPGHAACTPPSCGSARLLLASTVCALLANCKLLQPPATAITCARPTGRVGPALPPNAAKTQDAWQPLLPLLASSNLLCFCCTVVLYNLTHMTAQLQGRVKNTLCACGAQGANKYGMEHSDRMRHGGGGAWWRSALVMSCAMLHAHIKVTDACPAGGVGLAYIRPNQGRLGACLRMVLAGRVLRGCLATLAAFSGLGCAPGGGRSHRGRAYTCISLLIALLILECDVIEVVRAGRGERHDDVARGDAGRRVRATQAGALPTRRQHEGAGAGRGRERDGRVAGRVDEADHEGRGAAGRRAGAEAGPHAKGVCAGATQRPHGCLRSAGQGRQQGSAWAAAWGPGRQGRGAVALPCWGAGGW